MPPVVASVSAVVDPWHTLDVPVIAEIGLTVTIVVVIHPVDAVYVIVLVPAKMPVTIPVDAPTVAWPGILLLQVPVPVVSLSVNVEPTHIEPVLLRIAVIGLTVIPKLRLQPVGNVYIMVSIPGAMPVTTCVLEPTVAIEVFVLLQAPPATPSVRLVVVPIHTALLPVIAPGNGLTVTDATAKQPPGNI